MPIVDYSFNNRIFTSREIGVISAEDALIWTDHLKEHAKVSSVPIVALVDAMSIKQILPPALDIFAKASFTPNVIAVIVATNVEVGVASRNIGLLGKRKQTIVCSTLQEAQAHALKLVGDILS